MDTKQYFYRNVIFSKQGKTISIVDIHNPKNDKEELDPWLGMVLQLADGQHTIEQLLQFMATQYNGSPPQNLKQTVESVVERMAQNRIIMLTEKPTELPYYLSMPYELLDIEKAKKELTKDKVELN
ncbi:MAG: hypothetical protein COA97_02675 [Flavobacteriales bacterium]|nr:MAG: hypothetical protein COA97_02675 [Flavobacteriales bacterium]